MKIWTKEELEAMGAYQLRTLAAALQCDLACTRRTLTCVDGSGELEREVALVNERATIEIANALTPSFKPYHAPAPAHEAVDRWSEFEQLQKDIWSAREKSEGRLPKAESEAAWAELRALETSFDNFGVIELRRPIGQWSVVVCVRPGGFMEDRIGVHRVYDSAPDNEQHGLCRWDPKRARLEVDKHCAWLIDPDKNPAP